MPYDSPDTDKFYGHDPADLHGHWWEGLWCTDERICEWGEDAA